MEEGRNRVVTAYDLGTVHHTLCHIFFHPDFTVGTGISPVQFSIKRSRGLYRR